MVGADGPIALRAAESGLRPQLSTRYRTATRRLYVHMYAPEIVRKLAPTRYFIRQFVACVRLPEVGP